MKEWDWFKSLMIEIYGEKDADAAGAAILRAVQETLKEMEKKI